MEEDLLHLLPWELLHDGKGFISPNNSICRLIEGPEVGLQPIQGRPLKVNVAFSSPLLCHDPDHGPVHDEKGIPRQPEEIDLPGILDIRSEMRKFDNLKETSFPVDFRIHRRTSIKRFSQLLKDEADVLHYSGHGNIGILCMENRHAIKEVMNSERLQRIKPSPTYQMALLSSCNTSSFRNTFVESIAGALLSKGLPIVIAMSRSISQDAAFILTENIYREISRCETLTEALRIAREEMEAGDGISLWEFSTPVLFLNKNMFKNRKDEKLILHIPEKEAERKVRVLKSGGILRENREEKFAGRRRELVEIAKFLDKAPGYEKKATFILGAGGIGKTALAIEAGHRFSEDFDCAVFASARRNLPPDEFRKLVKASRREHIAKDSREFLNKIIKEIYLVESFLEPETKLASASSTPDILEPSEEIYRKLKNGKEWLLILDNLEDLTDDIEEKERLHEDIVSFLDNIPNEKCSVILTSRWEFSNLTFQCHEIDLRSLEARDVVELIIRHRRGWKKIPEWKEVMKIHDKTGGHPFALLLALSRLIEEGIPLDEILSEIGDEKDKAWEYLFDASLKRVGEEGKTLIGALSLFSSDCEVKALQYTVKDWVNKPRDVLGRLHRLSLVQKRTIPFLQPRYCILPITFPFAKNILDKGNLEATLKKNIGLYFLSQTKRVLGKDGAGDPSKEYLFLQEIYNINLSGGYLQIQGFWDDALSLYKFGLEFSERLGDERDTSMFLGNMGLVYKDKGEWDKAIELYKKSLNLKEKAGDIHGIARTYNNMGLVFRDKGEWNKAIEFFKKSLNLKEKVEDIYNMAQTYNNVGSVYLIKGELDKALEFFKKSLNIREKAEDIYNVAHTYNNMGLVYKDKGEWNNALEFFKKSLNLKEKVGDIRGMAQTYGNIGSVYQAKGEWDKAIELYKKSLNLYEKVGDIHGMAQTYNNIGPVYQAKGELDKALEFYKKSLNLYEKVGDIRGMAQTYGNIGPVYLVKSELDKALEFFKKSLNTLKKVGDIRGMAQTYNNMGLVFRDKGEWNNALKFYKKSLHLKEKVGDIHGMAQTYANIGILSLSKSDITKAKQYLNVALQIFKKLGHVPNIKKILSILQSIEGKATVTDEEPSLEQTIEMMREIVAREGFGKVEKMLKQIGAGENEIEKIRDILEN